MCEKIKLIIYDWDCFIKNDVVGIIYLYFFKIVVFGGEVEDFLFLGIGVVLYIVNIGEIEVGFVLMFGFCYLNFYGSFREYMGFLDFYDELNIGKGEGVVYRGRILVELVIFFEKILLDKKFEFILNDDLLVVEKY